MEINSVTNSQQFQFNMQQTDSGNHATQGHKSASVSPQDSNQEQEISIGYQEKSLINAIEKANKKFESESKEFQFSVHEKTKQIMIKVVDTRTHEVIREIPSEKILDIISSICEQAGLLVDQKR